MKRRPKVVLAFAVLCASLILGATVASAVPPLTTVEDATSVKYTTAHVAGEVDRQGQVTSYFFQYVSQAEFEAEGFANPHGSEGAQGTLEEGGPGLQPVEGELSGLTPGTVYHLRLLAENEDGSSKSVAPSTFETEAVSAPDAILLAPVVGSDSAQLKGEVDLGGTDPAFDATAHFEVSTDGGNTWAGFEGSEIGLSTSEGQVQEFTRTLTGLEPNTTYELRLRATNNANNGLEDTDSGQSFSVGALPPTVETLGTLDFTGTEVTFNGRINPHKAQTTYWFEWGTEPGSYTASVPLAKDGDAGAANQQVPVAETISGLDPATTVYYRLVAENGTGGEVAGEEREATTREVAGPPAPCPNQAIREEQSATFLPECRAWEQVSPNDKNGVDVQNFLKVNKAGTGVAWTSLGAYAGTPGANADVPYVAKRTTDGRWVTTSFFPRFTPTAGVGLFNPLGGYAWDEELRTMTFVTRAPFDPEDRDFNFIGTIPFPIVFDVYRVGDDGNAQWVSRNQGMTPTNEQVDARMTGVAANGSSLFIETSESLLPEVPPSETPNCLQDALKQLCNLYRWNDGQLEQVAYDENGVPLRSAGLGSSTTVGPASGGGSAGDLPDSTAISADGSSFVYGGYPQSGEGHQVYLHRPDGTVVRVSSSQRSGSIGEPAGGVSGNGTSGASYVVATGDLSKIYIRTSDQLTDDAPVNGGDYWYDVASGVLTFSNVDDQLAFLLQTGGFIRASNNGHYVYFASHRALANGARESVSGEFGSNIYVAGSLGLRYVGGIAGNDIKTTLNSQVAGAPEFTSTAASKDGSRFLFQTSHSNIAGAPADVMQVYLYDATTDSLKCLSCPPFGVTPGASGFSQESDLGTPTPRAISADGSRIAFTSNAALVPQDTNGVGDVYEYLDGELHLISSGTSPYRSFFVGMSESGDDLFFMTREPLAASDTDGGQYDVYDAHVDGGFAGPPTMAAPCAEDSCQAAPSAAPPAAAIASEIPNVGNPKTNKTKPHKHKKKHHKKKHKAGKKHNHKKKAANQRAGNDRRASR